MTESKLKQSAMDSVGEIKMSANNNQVAGSHYKNLPMQTWDYITQNGIGYMEGNIIKYVSRWKEKGGIDDLKKAQHYLEKLIEVSGAQAKKPLSDIDSASEEYQQWQESQKIARKEG